MSAIKGNWGKGVAALAVALVLAGCGERSVLGSRSMPDETQVVDGPNLVLPPNFDLRPPRTAADYESVLREEKNAQVRALVTGVSASEISPEAGDEAGTAPAGDQWLLNKAGRVDRDIRKTLEDDAAADKVAEKKNQSIWKRWFGGSRTN